MNRKLRIGRCRNVRVKFKSYESTFFTFFLCAYVEIIPHAKFFIIFFILCAVNFWVVLLVSVAGNVVTLCKHMFFF